MKELIGVIPAAGLGTRLFPYNGGKEILPVGTQDININGKIEVRPKIVSQYIIEAMAKAGIKKIIVITTAHKHNLMSLHSDGSKYGVRIVYIVLPSVSGSMPHSIDLAYEWIKSSTVVMGMPDTIVVPDDCISQLLDKHEQHKADLSLGLFPTDKPHKFGMIETDSHSNITYHQDKPAKTDATMMWGLAVWEPEFTHILHQEVKNQPLSGKEMPLGHVFDVMRIHGKSCKAYPITDGAYYDIGTYDDYLRAINDLSYRHKSPSSSHDTIS